MITLYALLILCSFGSHKQRKRNAAKISTKTVTLPFPFQAGIMDNVPAQSLREAFFSATQCRLEKCCFTKKENSSQTAECDGLITYVNPEDFKISESEIVERFCATIDK